VRQERLLRWKPREKGDSDDPTLFPVGFRIRAAARRPRLGAGVVPDHGAGRPESH
jgi:hypothetical protein